MIGKWQSRCWVLLALNVGWVTHVCAQQGESLETLRTKLSLRTDALERPLLELSAKYEKQLRGLVNKLGRTGNLESVLVVKQELEDHEKNSASSSSFSKLPELARLQRIYRQSRLQLEQARDRKVLKLYEGHAKQLASLEKKLTTQRLIDEAAKVRKEREAATALLQKTRQRVTFRPGFRMRGRFYVDVDDQVTIYRGGKQLYHRNNFRGTGKSELVELAVGDRLLFSVRNHGSGPRRFKVVFIAQDKPYMVNFRVADFAEFDELLGQRREFTEEEFAKGDREVVMEDGVEPRNPFEFPNKSQFVWGRGSHTMLGTTITPEMCAQR